MFFVHSRYWMLQGVATGIFVVLIAALAARAEIPAGKNVQTEKDYLDREAEFDLKLALDGYKSHGLRDRKWDAAAAEFIERSLRLFITRPTFDAPVDLVTQGHELIQRRCKDPLVQFLYGWTLKEPDGKLKPGSLMRDGAMKLRKQGYDPVLQVIALTHVADWHADNGYYYDVVKYTDKVVESLPDLFKGQSYAAGQRDILCRHLFRATARMSSEQRQAIWQAVKDVQGADAVAVLLLEGQYHISAAWKARGGDLAYKVPTDAWKGFSDELGRAGESLAKAWELDKTIPEPPTAMIAVAMGAAPADMRKWFDRAVAARLDYRNAYSSYLWGLYPRWHGNRETLVSFALECADTRRYDTKVPLFILDVLGAVQSECDAGAWTVWQDPAMYARVKDVIDQSTAPKGVRPSGAYYLSAEAAIGAKTGHWDDARKVLDGMSDPVDDKATRMMTRTNAQMIRGMVYAYSGPTAAKFLAARALAADGKREQALDAYQAAFKDQQNPDGIQYLRGVIQALQWESDLAHGKKISLRADAALSGFEVKDGAWHADADGGMFAAATSSQNLRLLCPADFGDSWELRTDVEFDHPRADWDVAGVLLSASDADDDMQIVIRLQPASLVIRHGGWNTIAAVPADLRSGANSLIVRRAGAMLTVQLNDHLLYTGAAPADDPKHHARIGLGGGPTSREDGVHFKNVTLRQFQPN